jgi:hypothetical protein
LATTAWQKVSDSLMIQLYNGAAIENVDGTLWSDVIRCNDLNNYIYGNSGDDEIYGMGGQDTLFGDAGNDTLRGGPGRDTMYGGPNNDSLLVNDDNDVDFAFGDEGADRFLVRTGTGGPNDTTDRTSEDARIFFEDGPAITVTFSTTTTPSSYAAGQWTAQDIDWVDAAFGELGRRTNNNNLVKTAAGGEMTFVRYGATLSGPGGIYGWNPGGGRIAINSYGISLGRSGIMQAVFHEIGHNWDTEYNAAGWRALSGWTNTNPNNPTYSQGTNPKQNWWYLTSAAFSSANGYYSHTDPDEDFAESFAAYFSQRAKLPNTASQIPNKIKFIDKMCTSKTTI